MSDKLDKALEIQVLMLLEEVLAQDVSEQEEYLNEQKDISDNVVDKVRIILRNNVIKRNDLQTGSAVYDHNDEDKAPERIGAYRIIRLIGRGGMGAVYLGERVDNSFDHIAAIKVVKSSLVSKTLIEKFEHERQLLAQLNHENIARLYDGGETDKGEPYIIMEYVNGISLLQWMEKHNPAIDVRLEIFSKICSAIAYAHSNLIIHRDLTPSNILVTDNLDIKIIDFGIAKLQQKENNGDHSSAGPSLSLTPGFAAPERFSGSSVTTAMDIYSLGKIFELLIDNADDELSAIASKATSTNPELRYQNADSLAEEVSNYKLGFPITAFSIKKNYQIGKFVKRHKLAVVASAMLIISLVGGLAATSWSYNRAEIARGNAEQRFNEVRQLANSLLFDIYDTVDDVPGNTSAKRLLAETGQSYLDSLRIDPNAPWQVRLEAGKAYMRLAHVMGGIGTGTLGLRDEAMANYQAADKILTELYEEKQNDPDIILALAELRYNRSLSMVYIAEDMKQGISFAQSAHNILNEGCDKSDACLILRAKTYNAEALNEYWLEKLDKAVSLSNQSIAIMNSLQEPKEHEKDIIQTKVAAYRTKGDALYYLNDLTKSIDSYDKANMILRNAFKQGHDSIKIKRDLALIQWARGGALDEAGKTKEAIKALDEAYMVIQEISNADTNDANSLRLVAVIGGQRGRTLSSAGRFNEGIKAVRDSLNIRQRLSLEQPNEVGFFRDVAVQLNAVADTYKKAGDYKQFCDYTKKTINKFNALDKKWKMSDFDRNDTYARAKKDLEQCQ